VYKKQQVLFGNNILVVEDNFINQQVIEEFLKLCGAHVDIANNGKEALQRLEQQRYDAVLMDIQMPVMGGIEATEYIRRQPQYKNLPIIAVSAGVTDDIRAHCLACGMNEFLPKPVILENLVHVLKVWIDKSNDRHPVSIPEIQKSSITTSAIITQFEANNFTVSSMLCVIPQSIIITDKNRLIIYANPACEALTGYSINDLFGKNCSLLQGTESDPNVIGLMKAALNAAQPFKGQILNYRKEGSTFWNELTITPLFDSAGCLSNFVSVQKDITALKKLHVIMRESEEKLRLKTEFLATMSHEIRTPINSIIGLTKLAMNQSDTSKLYDYLFKIDSSSNTLLGILNDILDFSKLEAGKFSIENTVFSLNALLDNLQALFSLSAQEKAINFDIQLAPEVPTKLLGDPLRLQQVLSNLISNAIKFTGCGGVKLTISLLALDKKQAKIHFNIIDTGIGISKQYASNLLLPFEQLDRSTGRLFGGTGLGLSISNSLLKLMGGSAMQIDSVLGQGSSFSFDLLLGVAIQEKFPAVNRRMTERLAGNLSLKLRNLGQGLAGKHILLAEDDRINQQIIKEFLAMCGVHVDVANNGAVVLQRLEHHSYDAILMDVQMPVIDGMDATKRIRMNPKYKTLPIIALSAGVTETERVDCINAGMDGFVPKPMVTEELIKVLVTLFEKRKSATASVEAEPPLNFKGFELDGILAIVGGNNSLLIKLLRDFSEDCVASGVAIEAQIKDNNIVAVQQLVHKLKGASGIVGVKKLYAATEALEVSLKQGQLDRELYAYFQEVLIQTTTTLANR
jgi:PAS domain S-box-containing protein